jgi:hypothetical protein
VIDPTPDILTGDKIIRVVELLSDIEVFDERSAVIRGARRIMFKFRFGRKARSSITCCSLELSTTCH